jgi:hypothetical protein
MADLPEQALERLGEPRAELGNRAVVDLSPLDQSHEFQVATALIFQLATRT